MEGIIQPILELIADNLVLGVILGMVIEEVFVPIPSPVIPMAAGTFIEAVTVPNAVAQIFLYIVIPGSLASVISSYFVYAIAYFGGEPVVKKYGRYLDLSWEDIQRVEKHFDHGYEKYHVALFRAIPIVPLSLISGSAGLFQMDWKQYGVWSFIGMLPRNFVLAYIGWTAKDSFMPIASQIDNLSTLVLIMVVGAVGAVIFYRNFKEAYKYLLKKI